LEEGGESDVFYHISLIIPVAFSFGTVSLVHEISKQCTQTG
jgi:hypothetical protein